MARLTQLAAAGILAAFGLATAGAQTPDLPADAPRVEDPDLTVPPTIASEPGQATLEPAPAGRDDMLSVVVTEGQEEFRLPDLGTSLREEREQQDPNQRIVLSPILLFDPEADPSVDDGFLEPEVLRGVGFIRMIEFRFGRNRQPD